MDIVGSARFPAWPRFRAGIQRIRAEGRLPRERVWLVRLRIAASAVTYAVMPTEAGDEPASVIGGFRSGVTPIAFGRFIGPPAAPPRATVHG